MKTIYGATLGALALAGCGDSGEVASTLAPVSGDLLIADVTVVDPEHGTREAHRDVLVTNGRIHLVETHGARALTATRTIDGAGKTLIPGLINMHAHSSYRGFHEPTLKLQFANGVLGVREMGSDCPQEGGMSLCLSDMQVSRDRIEAGEMVGPRLLQLSSAKTSEQRGPDASALEILYRPTSAEDAARTVAGLKARGAEIIKISENFTPATFEGLMAAAKAEGIPVGGHIPLFLSVGEVSRMGITSIEHARDLPVDCSSAGPELRDHMRRKLTGEDLPWPDRMKLPAAAVAGFDEDRCKGEIQAMVDNHVYYVPTHLTREMDYRATEEAYRDDPRLAYIHPMQQRHWNGDLDRTAEGLGPIKDDLAAFYALGLKTTGMAHAAGVKVMAGTDANDTMVFPGFSMHDELANLIEAGLTPMEALQAATSVPAAYLGRADLGGISRGKLADLVLIDGDPTADIANTTRIRAVIQGGRVAGRAALDALLEEVKAFAAGPTSETD